MSLSRSCLAGPSLFQQQKSLQTVKPTPPDSLSPFLQLVYKILQRQQFWALRKRGLGCGWRLRGVRQQPRNSFHLMALISCRFGFSSSPSLIPRWTLASNVLVFKLNWDFPAEETLVVVVPKFPLHHQFYLEQEEKNWENKTRTSPRARMDLTMNPGCRRKQVA